MTPASAAATRLDFDSDALGGPAAIGRIVAGDARVEHGVKKS